VSALLTMVIAPLILLDRVPGQPRSRWEPPPLLACLLLGIATVALQSPTAIGVMSRGGLVPLLALAAMLVMSLGFWSVVLPLGDRLGGMLAAGYVLFGGVLISMPATLIILVPTDIYAAFHAQEASTVAPLTDQVVSGFILFAAVKIAVFTVFTVIFRDATREIAAEERDGDGGSRVPPPPDVPDWALRLSEGAPTTAEPRPRPAVGAGLHRKVRPVEDHLAGDLPDQR
jgi:cytochrome c oxidase assembly factor CtaG